MSVVCCSIVFRSVFGVLNTMVFSVSLYIDSQVNEDINMTFVRSNSRKFLSKYFIL